MRSTNVEFNALRMEARRLYVWCRIGSVHIREFRASRGRRSALSATARLLGWCVAFGLTLSVSSVLAGPNVMVGGTHVSWMALGQAGQSDSATSRRDADKWLRQAREAMKNGNLDFAEYCLERAETDECQAGLAVDSVQGLAGEGTPGPRGVAEAPSKAKSGTPGPLAKLFHKDGENGGVQPPADPYGSPWRPLRRAAADGWTRRRIGPSRLPTTRSGSEKELPASAPGGDR